MTPALLALLAVVGLAALARFAAARGRGRDALRAAGGAALAGAALLFLMRQVPLAIVAATTGAALLGQAGRMSPPARGRVSTVRTRVLEMRLDHDSGAMDGEVLSGPFEGRRLSTLSRDELLQLAAGVDAQDAETLSLLSAYLDRAHPGWREADATPPPPSGGAMTRAEALAILGLEPGADAAAIHAAHRRLMKRVHPDLGGSAALAAQINAAKDLLLS